MSVKEPIKIKVNDKLKTVGHLFIEEQEAHLELSSNRESDYDKGAWKLYKGLIHHLASIQYTVIVKDSVTKWIFKCSAVDIIYHGKEEGKFIVMDAHLFEVLKGSKRTLVVGCQVATCPHNFGNQCLKGGIQINKEGVCKWLC